MNGDPPYILQPESIVMLSGKMINETSRINKDTEI